tara:strand:+ start:402 stop:557 length:156 start_codon:yes stop_codon:yes gene_type:complete
MEMKKKENEEQINKNSQLMISVVGVFGKRRKVVYLIIYCSREKKKNSPDLF